VVNPNASLSQVLIATSPSGTMTDYVYGLGLAYEDSGGTARYYSYDRRGNTVALTDANGSLLGQFTYGPYGEVLTSSGQTNTPFQFNGLYGVMTDSNGLCHSRARYYSPQLRRFINQDVILGSVSIAASLNRYAYANGNPVNANDPFGLMASDQNPSGWNPQLQPFWSQSIQDQEQDPSTIFSDPGLFGQPADNDLDSATSSGTYQALLVTSPDGTQYMPVTEVKNQAQANQLGVPVGTIAPIIVPPGQDPQGMINDWTGFSLGNNPYNFAWTWRPDGPNDYKNAQPPQTSIYDAYGNFEYGATGQASGNFIDGSVLTTMGDISHGGTNNPVNTQDIQSGVNTVKNGGTVSVVPVQFP
jgi:RHS repeat-associated protein